MWSRNQHRDFGRKRKNRRPRRIRFLRAAAAAPVARDQRDVEVLDQRVEKAALEFVIGDRACADVHESQGGKNQGHVDQRLRHGDRQPKPVPSLRPSTVHRASTAGLNTMRPRMK